MQKLVLNLYQNLTCAQVVGCQVGAKQKSREHAGTLVALSPRTIAEWVRDFETTTYITESRRGKHSKTVSPINNPSFREEFRTHVKENSRKSGNFNSVCEQSPILSNYFFNVIKLRLRMATLMVLSFVLY